jgi:hypothetical protein
MFCRQCPRERARLKRCRTAKLRPEMIAEDINKLPVNGIACDERTDGSGGKDDITARILCCRQNFPIEGHEFPDLAWAKAV